MSRRAGNIESDHVGAAVVVGTGDRGAQRTRTAVIRVCDDIRDRTRRQRGRGEQKDETQPLGEERAAAEM